MISIRDLWQAWKQFWFAPESPIPVAVFRILFGLLVLQFGWFMSGELHWLLGQQAIVSQSANDAWNVTARINVLKLLPGNDGALDAFWVVFMIAAACLTFGLCTRLSAVIVYVALISCDARNSFIFTGADNVMRVESFLLMFSQCGAALSVDRLLAVWRAGKPSLGPVAPSNPWALKLIQVQVALCYWAAYAAKICGPTWISGSAVYYIVHIVEENKYAFPYLYDHLWTCQWLSWGTLFIEFCLCILIWIKELRLPIILAAIPFHLGLDYTLIIPQFQFVMLASLMTFIEPSTYGKISSFIRGIAGKALGKPLVAYYDGALDLPCRLAETIRRLDVLRLVQLLDSRQEGGPLGEDQLSAIRGRSGIFAVCPAEAGYLHGVRALRKIVWRLPLVAPVYPLLWLPGCGALAGGVISVLRKVYPSRSSAEPALVP